jgi:hypothetical protein
MSRFEIPPTLVTIFAMTPPATQMEAFADFVFYKEFHALHPLTKPEAKFRDTARLYGEILSGGWHSPFYQIYSWTQWDDIIEVLQFCGHVETASAIAEARHIFYRNRTDLLTIESRVAAGLVGFHLTPSEEDQFYELGEFVEEQLIDDCLDITRWPLAHRESFVDFPR